MSYEVWAKLYWTEKLRIINRVGAVAEIKTMSETPKLKSFDPREKFPKLFEGLGRFKIQYTIRKRSDACPYALTTPRRIPIPLLKEIKVNLDKWFHLELLHR